MVENRLCILSDKEGTRYQQPREPKLKPCMNGLPKTPSNSFSLLFILSMLLDLDFFFPSHWQISNLMARALSWQMRDKGLKSTEPKRNGELGSTTAVRGTHHRCSPLLLWDFFVLILMVTVCTSLRSDTAEATKTPGFINPKGRQLFWISWSSLRKWEVNI